MADPELGPLKIEQDRRRAVEFLFERSDMLDQFGLLLLVAVAHVDSKRIGAGEHELADHSRVARGGPESCENFHFPRSWRESFDHLVSSPQPFGASTSP